MAQVSFLDYILKEYLVFRGFSNTLKALDVEQRIEKDNSFRAEKILEQFNQFIQGNDLQSLRTLWTHLDNNLFSKLEHTYAVAVKKLENSLLKLYLITCYSNNRMDKVNEFFHILSIELQQQSEWKDWFYFPFCKNAEDSLTFSLYFTKQWQDTLQISLRNFLTTIYQCLPQPTFVRAEQEANYIKRLQDENAHLKTRLQVQQNQNVAAASGSNTNLAASSIDLPTPRRRSTYKQQHSLNDILPFDVSPPSHIVDDFCIIATEVNNISNASDVQARGLKMLIRNIGTGNSPVMVRKEAFGGASDKSNKRRSGSVGRSWI